MEIRIPRAIQVGAGRPRLIWLPVLARVERIAEKVRAFLERGLDRDAFDLHYHALRLSETDRPLLGGLIQRKLASGELREGCDLHRQFATALEGARQAWPRGLVIVSNLPEWTEVERVLNLKYKPLLRTPTSLSVAESLRAMPMGAQLIFC